jgi:hypothetical protein
MYMICFKKIVIYYIRKHKKLKNQFVVMIWNYHHLKKWIGTFQKIHLPKHLYAFIITIYKKSCSETHLYEKVIFGQKDM